MRLKQDVITEFLADWYPSCRDAETLFDRAHREIVSTLPVRSGHTDVPIVAGTSSYVLPDNVFRVEDAFYAPSSDLGAWRRLTPYDFSYEPYDGYSWPYGTSNATPSEGWRVVANALTPGGGLSFEIGPTPDVTTAGGYPFIRLYGSVWQVLAVTDELPKGLLSERIYLLHMAAAWAERQDETRYPKWKELYDDAHAGNMRHLKDRMPKTAANRIVPMTARTQTRRV